MNNIEIYLVGGAVRDEIMGRKSNDLDYTVVAPSFDAMREWLLAQGFVIFIESPEFLTIRARNPGTRETADFVLARKEGAYSDGRRPDEVEMGTLMDDLARRDFTMNAIAQDAEGNYIDPFGGRADIADKVIRAVGNASDRFNEDSLRALRALRFSITLGFDIEWETMYAMMGREFAESLRNVSQERIREELHKMFSFDTKATLELFYTRPWARDIANVVLDGIWLMPTTKKVKRK